ncbi:MAG: hypothetical protein IPN19_04610 [Elusimicrobia bacterium]|nr:hypothetical protein [Elusimicrobiota bacterium]
MDLVRQAKEKLRSPPTAPHHFTLTEEAVVRCGTNAKDEPPLRAERGSPGDHRGP